MGVSAEVPPAANAVADKFITSMLAEDYVAAQKTFAARSRPQYTATMLSRIRPILGTSPNDTLRFHYRLSANTVWYDAVTLKQPDDPATYLELIMSTQSNTTEIASLTFKGRM